MEDRGNGKLLTFVFASILPLAKMPKGGERSLEIEFQILHHEGILIKREK
jgi:hypothetical protein